jgi:predicted phosphoribosyltransferase
MRFQNRNDAGRQLAARLTDYDNRSDVIVLALPRGGVPVASEVATRLKAPLDVFLVRKLGVPGHPELAMGAIAAGGVEVLSNDLIEDLGIPLALVQQVAVRERLELDRRAAAASRMKTRACLDHCSGTRVIDTCWPRVACRSVLTSVRACETCSISTQSYSWR